MIGRFRVEFPAGAAGEFSSPGSTLCADSYFSIRSTPGLRQQYVKDPDHSAKRVGDMVTAEHTCTLCMPWLRIK